MGAACGQQLEGNLGRVRFPCLSELAQDKVRLRFALHPIQYGDRYQVATLLFALAWNSTSHTPLRQHVCLCIESLAIFAVGFRSGSLDRGVSEHPLCFQRDTRDGN